MSDKHILELNHKYESELATLKAKLNADECYFRNNDKFDAMDSAIYVRRDNKHAVTPVNSEAFDKSNIWDYLVKIIDDKLTNLTNNQPLQSIKHTR